jgi:hypothetical protein
MPHHNSTNNTGSNTKSIEKITLLISVFTSLLSVVGLIYTISKDKKDFSQRQVELFHLLEKDKKDWQQKVVEFSSNNRKFDSTFNFQRHSLDTQLASNLRLALLQNRGEIEKERRYLDVSTLTAVSNSMDLLLHKSPDEEQFIKSKDKLYELKPGVLILGGKYFNLLETFEKYIYDYELTEKILLKLDTLRNLSFSVVENYNRVESSNYENKFINVDATERKTFYSLKVNQVDEIVSSISSLSNKLAVLFDTRDTIRGAIYGNMRGLSAFMVFNLHPFRDSLNRMKQIYSLSNHQQLDTADFKNLIAIKDFNDFNTSNDGLINGFSELKKTILEKLIATKRSYDSLMKSSVNFYR